jgi:hypothetical protein
MNGQQRATANSEMLSGERFFEWNVGSVPIRLLNKATFDKNLKAKNCLESLASYGEACREVALELASCGQTD